MGFIISFSGIGWAQQNLFNVPSDITKKNELFFQEQINLAPVHGSGHTTFTYGLGNNAEVGINLFNVDIYSLRKSRQNPYFLFNARKGFDITRFHTISLGTQTGLTLPWYDRTIQMPSFSYLSNAIDLEKWGKYYLGAYYANRAYAGSGNSVGLMAGAEYVLIRKKLHIIGDFLSGHNDISTAVVGPVFYLPNNWHISLGAQLPAPGSKNDYGVVFQLTNR